MTFRVSMINAIGKLPDETFIANNEKQGKRKAQKINPKSSVFEAKWVYK